MFDGGGALVAEADYNYDEQTSGLTPTSGVTNHDYTNYSSTVVVGRRNLTSAIQCIITSGSCAANSPKTTYAYDDTGQVRSMTDPCGNTACSDMTGSNHITTYSYGDSYTVLSGGTNQAYSPSAPTNTFLTQTINPLGHTRNFKYDFNNGQLTASQDQNDINAGRAGTTYLYNDSFARPTQINYPDGGQTTITYNDSPYNASTPSPSVTTMKKITGTSNLVTLGAMDGLGHVVQNRLCEDGSACTQPIKTDITFDDSGRVWKQSNPHRAASSPTDVTTTYSYDALGRTTKVIPPDGSAFANNVSISYSGNCTTVADQASKPRKTCTDGVGRLIEVDEPGTGAQLASSGSGQLTVTGTEQSKTIPATHSTGSITINSVSTPNSQSVTVGSYTCHLSLPTSASASSAASAVASCLNGHLVTATASSNVVNLTSIATGNGTNYGINWSGFTGSHSGMSGGADSYTIYDSGTLTVTVNGFPASASFGSASTPGTLASALTTALSAFGSPVAATANGATITLTAVGVGSATNYSVSTSVTWNTSNFASASFNFQAPVISALTGGSDSTFGTTPLVTLYTYDALNNLLSVTQKGGSTDSTQWRPRSFAYDSLSRLTSSTNPESNTVSSTGAIVPTTYAYDANSNLSSKTSPAPNQTSTATVTATYTYDVRNRVTQKSFSDGTSTVKYGYDAVSPSGCTLPTLTINNGIGKRTGMCDAAGSEAWSYDITSGTGWKTTDARITNGLSPKTSIYQDNFVGSLVSLTYPSTRIVNYASDGAARALSAIDSTGPINYSTAAAYAPTGALSSLTNDASLVSTLYYNSRLQPCRISVKNTGTAPSSCTDTANIGGILDFTYGFNLGSADNGNVASITNNRDNTRSQNFTYDFLNRLATAQTQTTGVTIPNYNCWGLTFGYDAWGNQLQSSITGPAGCPEPLPLNVAVATSNRISTNTVAGTVTNYCYDSAGNLIHTVAAPSTCPPSGFQNTYNAENQLTSTAGVTYTYDGDGKRVMKSNGKLYWYGMASDPLDETDLTGVTTNSGFKEYVFFGGKRIASRDYQNNVNYYFADHLGTARVVTNASGSILDDSDFYPFGGERPACEPNGAPGCTMPPGSGNSYKFTSKERDSESGLDNFGARYDSSSMGRFISPDSTAYVKPINPQSWNLYAYALNNPLLYVDPTGNTVSLSNCQDQNRCLQVLINAAQLPKGVTAEVDKNGNLVLKGDLSKIKGGNALRLKQMVDSDKTASFWIGDKAPGVEARQTQAVKGGLSGTPSEEYSSTWSVVNSDPSQADEDAKGGYFLSADGQSATPGEIPGADIEEAAAHEFLGHVWAELVGGQPAFVNHQVNPANLKEALIAEDRVRRTDPSRGIKIYHHDYGKALIGPSDVPRITNPGGKP